MTGRSRASSDPARPARPVLVVVGLLAVGVGLLAAWLAYGPGRLPDAAPHVAAAWTAIGCGLIAWWRVPASRCGPLLVAAGGALFLADLATCLNIEPISHRCLRLEPVSSVAGALSWLWLGLLGWAILSAPTGRSGRGRLGLAVVAVVAATLLIPVEPVPATAIAVAILVLVPLARWAGAAGDARADRHPAAIAGPVVGAALAFDAGGLVPAYLLELGVGLASIALLVGLLAVEERRRALSVDRAVELGDALAGAVGDPGLQVLVPTAGGWLDLGGRVAAPPDDGEDPPLTMIRRDGVVIAAIRHAPGTLQDDQVRDAVIRAVELAAHHVRLRADVDAQVAAVDASRRRLLDAALHERRELGLRVDSQVDRPLVAVTTELAAARATGTDPAVLGGVAGAQEALARVRREIEDLSRGLYPRVLAEAGMAPALRDLADRAPVPVTIQGDDGGTGGADMDATIYFLCAEALANAARHAPGATVRISLARAAGVVTITIADDGPGGATVDRGTGLRGLQDRVEALGGRLLIDSPAGGGTRLQATIPD